jgi:FixJ family two-component response regulator
MERIEPKSNVQKAELRPECASEDNMLNTEMKALWRGVDVSSAKIPRIGPRRIRVALLDDDESVRKAVSRLLAASDIEVSTFAVGHELLLWLKHQRPNCLILDLQMPKINGFGVMDALHRANIHLPIVVITAHDIPGMGDEAIAAGAVTYLRKPFEESALLAAIAKAIAQAGSPPN